MATLEIGGVGAPIFKRQRSVIMYSNGSWRWRSVWAPLKKLVASVMWFFLFAISPWKRNWGVLRSLKYDGVHERNKACTYCRPWPPRLRLWQGSSCRSYRPPTVTQACFTHAHLICKIYIESNVTIRFLHWAKRILVCCNVTSNTLSLLYNSWYHIWTS